MLALGLLVSGLRAEDAVKDRLWYIDLGQYISSTPAIGHDGTIYVTASGNLNYADVSGGKLAAISPQGVEKWSYRTRCDIKSSPAVGADGAIYFGCRDRKFYAISPEGKLKWSFTAGAWVDSSPAIGANGAVYFGSWDKKFYAVNADGSKRWEFATGGPVDSSAAIGKDGTIYFGSHDQKFYAVNPEGTVRWSFATEGAIISSPALDAEGVVYFTSVDGRLYALNPDGSKKWASWTGGVRESSPVIDAQGNIYVAVNDMFHAYKPDGGKLWDFGYPVIDGSAAIAGDGAVCFGTDGGTLFVFNGDGVIRSAHNLGGKIVGSPAIGEDGTIYVGAYGLSAIKGRMGLAKAGWPKFHGGARQTGRLDAD